MTHLAALSLDVRRLADDGGLLDQLAALLPEPVGDPARGTSSHHKVTGSPAPWHPEAGVALLTIHEGARRLEASLRRDSAGRLGGRRGGSDTNTRDALRSIVRLAEAVPEDRARLAARIVAGWVQTAAQVGDIDQADRWVPLPRLPGHLPPACEYCGAYSLRWSRHRGEVRCCTPDCTDPDGNRPRARMETGRYSGRASLVWQDGRSVVYAVPEPAP
ncbi:hypothetical protein amrb99_98140 [Actinomadura sp. RB99]|uniref:hypothetical protein n=1 Tax=Actinomadura sp. RB99 TaxID=2691577 RepID=UPI001682397D|nr:hypothetical protein [Actinomadura sp. RB99]MBD2900804.1 hypothetical protein [Actinomadura sp. RB99]